MTEVGIISSSKVGFNKVGATGLLAKGCKCKVGKNRKKNPILYVIDCLYLIDYKLFEAQK